MTYPDDASGDVFRRVESHELDFSTEHVLDFHPVFATEAMADQIAEMYLADHKAFIVRVAGNHDFHIYGLLRSDWAATQQPVEADQA